MVRKVSWVHPYYEVCVEIPEACYGRQRLQLFLEMPACKLQLNRCFSEVPYQGNIAYYIPIFFLESGVRSRTNLAYLHGYLKRAFWMAYEFSEYVGLQENNADFFIVIEEELRILIEPYRQACGFPESRIIAVPGMSRYPAYLPKIAMMPYLADRTDYAYYVSLDASVTFMQPTAFGREMQSYWTAYPEHILFLQDPWKVPSHFSDIRSKTPYRSQCAASGADLGAYLTQMPSFFNEQNYETFSHRMHKHPLYIASPIFGFPRSHFDARAFKDFLDFVVRRRCLFHDESFLCHYWHRYLAPNKEIYSSIPENLEKHDIVKFRYRSSENTIFIHYSDSGKSDSQFFVDYIEHLNERNM